MLAVATACGTSTSASRATAAASPSPSAGPRDANLTVVTREIRETRKALHGVADVKYPQIQGLPDSKVLAAINDKLQGDARKAVADFFADLQKEPPSPRPGTSPDAPENTSTLDGSFQPVMVGPVAASFREFLVHYAAGAAHPGTTLQTYSFDLGTGHLYTLAELFKPGSNYLGLLSEVSRKLLPIEMGTPLPEIEEGTKPTPESFDGWALAPDGIEITFGQYQVAPYAAGMPRILVLTLAMQDMTVDDGPL